MFHSKRSTVVAFLLLMLVLVASFASADCTVDPSIITVGLKSVLKSSTVVAQANIGGVLHVAVTYNAGVAPAAVAAKLPPGSVLLMAAQGGIHAEMMLVGFKDFLGQAFNAGTCRISLDNCEDCARYTVWVPEPEIHTARHGQHYDSWCAPAFMDFHPTSPGIISVLCGDPYVSAGNFDWERHAPRGSQSPYGVVESIEPLPGAGDRPILVWVQFLTGLRVAVFMHTSQTVAAIASEVERKTNGRVKAGEVALTLVKSTLKGFAGKLPQPLDKTQLISHYPGIEDHSLLAATLRLRGGSGGEEDIALISAGAAHKAAVDEHLDRHRSK